MRRAVSASSPLVRWMRVRSPSVRESPIRQSDCKRESSF